MVEKRKQEEGEKEGFFGAGEGLLSAEQKSFQKDSKPKQPFFYQSFTFCVQPFQPLTTLLIIRRFSLKAHISGHLQPLFSLPHTTAIGIPCSKPQDTG